MSSRRSSWVEEFFNIQLLNPDSVVHAGRVLKGKLTLHLRNPLRNGVIRMAVTGRAQTSWKEQQNNGKTSKVVRYTGEQTLIHQPISIWDKETRAQNGDHRLEIGTHSFPFEIQIPSACPSSFEGKHGFVQYQCKAMVSKPLKMDYEIKVPFTVIGLVDLNRIEPSHFEPVVKQAIGREKDGVRCSLRLAKSAFVPGEVIAIQAKVHNDSKDAVMGGVRALLRQTVVFRGRDKGGREKDKERMLIAEEVCKKQQIEPGSFQEWSSEGIKIPPTPPTLSDPNSLIQVSYELQFEVPQAFTLSLPLTIGSLPRRDPSLPPPTPTHPGERPHSYWEILRTVPPPAYEECVYGIQRSESEEGGSGAPSQSSPHPHPHSQNPQRQNEHLSYNPRYVNYSPAHNSTQVSTSPTH